MSPSIPAAKAGGAKKHCLLRCCEKFKILRIGIRFDFEFFLRLAASTFLRRLPRSCGVWVLAHLECASILSFLAPCSQHFFAPPALVLWSLGARAFGMRIGFEFSCASQPVFFALPSLVLWDFGARVFGMRIGFEFSCACIRCFGYRQRAQWF